MIFPYFGYRDAAAALEWHVRAFGFKRTAKVPGPDAAIITTR